MDTEDTIEIKNQVAERMKELPDSVQVAIQEAEVEKKLRSLSSKYKLHLDQWVLLENEIMLTLLDLQEPEQMVPNVSKKVGVDLALAQQIVNDIAIEVFRPIHERLRGDLNPEALDRGTVAVGHGAQEPETEQRDADPTQTSTEETETQEQEKSAPMDSTAYAPGQRSTERRDVQEDPYRESID